MKKNILPFIPIVILFASEFFIHYGLAFILVFILSFAFFSYKKIKINVNFTSVSYAFAIGFVFWFLHSFYFFQLNPRLTVRLAAFMKIDYPQVLVFATGIIGGFYALSFFLLLAGVLNTHIRKFKWIINTIVGFVFFLLVSLPLGALPSMILFFNPNTGFWQNQKSEIQRLTKIQKNIKPHIKNAKVVFDDRLIPHIFAEDEKDLFFLQGYIEAALRLWQMDVQTRAAEGRVSELVGEKTLNRDKFFRRLGIPYATKIALEELKKDPETYEIIKAYSEGVNTYINSLSYKELPVEYKLMQFEPEKWSPYRTLLLIKFMAWRLLPPNKEKELTRALLKYGKTSIDSLFPDYAYVGTKYPIIPPETNFDFEPVKIPEVPKTAYNNPEFTKYADSILMAKNFEASNNWAVAGMKTKSGNTILCNDPHLALKLPAIWLEQHLVSKDVNVYGVSLLGAPGIIIGFNENISWGLTNVGPDVMDLFLVKRNNNKYFYKNSWKDFVVKYDTIKIKGGNFVVDTIYYTEIGPMLSEHINVRWTAYQPSNEAKTFILLNKAQNYEDYVQALKYFYAPPQNFAYADKINIAIWSNGYYPLKWKGQGKYVGLLEDTIYHWKGRVPAEHNPNVKNPMRGFVASANQPPVNENYPYYLGSEFENFTRGARIIEVLNQMTQITIDSMKKLQQDTKNMLAEYILPTLLKYTDSTKYGKEFSLLKSWDYNHTAHSIPATIFTEWFKQIEKTVWSDELGKLKPKKETTAYFIKNFPTSHWFDIKTTKEKETVKAIINISLQKALKKLRERFGENTDKWAWSMYKHTHIPHIALGDPFGIPYVETGGGKGIVNAISTTWGPSWRMIVERGDSIVAYGIYPGGQSGNPASFYYDNFVKDWAKGIYYKLNFVKNPEKIKKSLIKWEF